MSPPVHFLGIESVVTLTSSLGESELRLDILGALISVLIWLSVMLFKCSKSSVIFF